MPSTNLKAYMSKKGKKRKGSKGYSKGKSKSSKGDKNNGMGYQKK